MVGLLCLQMHIIKGQLHIIIHVLNERTSYATFSGFSNSEKALGVYTQNRRGCVCEHRLPPPVLRNTMCIHSNTRATSFKKGVPKCQGSVAVGVCVPCTPRPASVVCFAYQSMLWHFRSIDHLLFSYVMEKNYIILYRISIIYFVSFHDIIMCSVLTDR